VGGAAAARGRARRLSLPDGGAAWADERDRHPRAAGGARGAHEMSWSGHMVRPGPAAGRGALHLRARSSGCGAPRVPEVTKQSVLDTLNQCVQHTHFTNRCVFWSRGLARPARRTRACTPTSCCLPARAAPRLVEGGLRPPPSLPATPAPPARRRRRDAAAARPDAARRVFGRRFRSRRSSTQDDAADAPPAAPRGAPPPLPAFAADAPGAAGRDSARGSER